MYNDYFPSDNEAATGCCFFIAACACLAPVVALVVLLVKVFGG